MEIPRETFLVCDMADPECIEAVDIVKAEGFSLRVYDVRDYEGLDFASPRLYAGQYMFEGFNQIKDFATRFGGLSGR